jgi:hypothetical protein
MIDLTDILRKGMCTLQYRPRKPEFIGKDLRTYIIRRGLQFPLGNCAGISTLDANFTAGLTGTMNGIAYGCDNWFNNLTNAIGTHFIYRFALEPDEYGLPGDEYQITSGVTIRGSMRHFPWVYEDNWAPISGSPAEETIGQVDYGIRVFELDNSGNRLQLGNTRETIHFLRVSAADVVAADNGQVLDLIHKHKVISINYTPSGNSLISFEVRIGVEAYAVGASSSIGVAGLGSRVAPFEVILRSPIAKRAYGDSGCDEILQNRREILNRREIIWTPIGQ